MSESNKVPENNTGQSEITQNTTAQYTEPQNTAVESGAA